MSDKMNEKIHAALVMRMIVRLNSDDCSASEMNVARQFLKDNNFDALPVKGGAVDSVAKAAMRADEADKDFEASILH